MNRTIPLALLLIGLSSPPALPCSICGGDFQNRLTLRQETGAATVVVIGTLSNARITSDATGQGQTDLSHEHVIKGRAALNGAMSQTLPRYYPGDGDGPKRGVFFFDIREGRPRLIAGRTIRTLQFATYLKSAATLIDAPVAESLSFFMRNLDHADADVAADAFLEVARAPDAEVARCAKSIPAERLRKLLANPRTPPERIGLIAFLLACGGDVKDAALLLGMLRDLPEDRQSMRRGLLAGYMVLKPNEGWSMAHAILADSKRGFLERYAVMGVLEFFHNWRPVEDRERVLHALKHAVASADLADMAAENLRRWRLWDLTDEIVAAYDRPGFDSEILRRAIVRYAIACPKPTAAKFVERVKKGEPDFFAEVVQSLEDEK